MEVTATRLKVYSLIGWMFFAFPLLILILWLISVITGSNDVERAEIFNSNFPEFLVNNVAIPLISSICALLAIVFAGMGSKIDNKIISIIDIFVIIISLLIFVLNLFSLF